MTVIPIVLTHRYLLTLEYNIIDLQCAENSVILYVTYHNYIVYRCDLGLSQKS